MGITRRRSLRVMPRAEELLPRIQALKADPPFWGYRCIWASRRVVAQGLVQSAADAAVAAGTPPLGHSPREAQGQADTNAQHTPTDQVP